MRSVATGSRAEHGSSISSTSGWMAIARAMHRRCCCPPESPVAAALRRSLTSSHRPAPVNARSMISSSSFFGLRPLSLYPATTLSTMDIVGKGLGRWKTIPTARRTATGSTSPS